MTLPANWPEKSELTDCVLEGLLQLHEELSVDPEAPWYVGTPDQTQVLHGVGGCLVRGRSLKPAAGGLHR
ncbi:MULTISPECIES: hypothetical protein [unclassified Synechococcus]|uniref:hypothetical protein n=1 Tax=unclassified Synechococcus TaxID=2626047 RepID=UPI0020CC84B2|nr:MULTISPECIES: hypothetical protein [unclassified Synechococcus]